MKLYMRMHRSIYDRMLQSLRHPHQFAAERVGFLSARLDDLDDGDKLALLNCYHHVRDEHYLRDPYVGARISGDAIREAMQRILDTGDGIFHVHLHHDGWPLGFSRSDLHGYVGLIPALRAVGPQLVHGALILNSTSSRGLVWLPGAAAPAPIHVLSVVGFPVILLGGNDNE